MQIIKMPMQPHTRRIMVYLILKLKVTQVQLFFNVGYFLTALFDTEWSQTVRSLSTTWSQNSKTRLSFVVLSCIVHSSTFVHHCRFSCFSLTLFYSSFFLPRNVMLARYMLWFRVCLSVCPSILPSVTGGNSTKTAKYRITQTRHTVVQRVQFSDAKDLHREIPVRSSPTNTGWVSQNR